MKTEALHFTRREKNGIASILVILILLILAPYAYFLLPAENMQMAMPPAEWPKPALTDSGRNYREGPHATNYRDRVNEDWPASPVRLFRFNPNTLDVEGWKKLGLSERVAGTIQRYRDKGGHFYRAEDIRKIRGLPPALAERLIPYVQIPEPERGRHAGKGGYQPMVIDINRADSAEWESLPGIGPATARRIVLFRDKLGGFYSVAQVAETYALPDSVYRKIKPRLQCTRPEIRRLNINTAPAELMKNHPYVRYRLAALLEAYRKQHGPFRELSDIRQIPLVTDSLYRKLEPYLAVQ